MVRPEVTHTPQPPQSVSADAQKRGRGRPRKSSGALTGAQRQAAYRARLKVAGKSESGSRLDLVRENQRLRDELASMKRELADAMTLLGMRASDRVMDAREAERHLLGRCVEAARDQQATARNALEANVFRLAGMVSRTEFPSEWRNLLLVSQRYFDRHPGALMEPGEAVRQGWVISFPRLRDSLRSRFREAQAHV